MNLVTPFFHYYQKWGLDDRLGLSPRTLNSLYNSETFVRKSFESDYAHALAALRDPLDDRSKAVVDKVLERHYYIYTHNLLDHRRVFSSDERRLRRILKRELPGLAGDLDIPLHLAEASVLYYHHGLRHTDLPMEDFQLRIKNRDVIDVGAAVGDSAYVFEKYYHPRKIYSFEPEVSRVPLLRRMIDRQGLKQVEIIEAALGPGENANESVDHFVAANDLSVGLIKMDVEGAEESVLAGARRTIVEQKPLLIVSMYHNANQFYNLLPMIQSVQPNYQFAVRKIDDRSPVFETTLFCW